MKPSIEKWKGLAQSELNRLGAPLPVELVLSIIRRESNGSESAVNPSSGASGLMQVMKIAVKDYNQNHERKYTMSELRASPTIQIRVGVWVLTQFVRSAYRYLKKRLKTVSLDDLIKVSDTFYAAGPKNARDRLDKITPTWENIKARYPKWDRVRPAELVWQRATDWGANWDLAPINAWLESTLVVEKKHAIGGAVVGLLILVIAWQYFGRQTNAK